MPPTPEKNPLEIDLDFTKPKDKLEDLEKKIAAAKRGIILAQSLPKPDEERTRALEKALRGFEATKKEIEEEERRKSTKQEFWVPATDEDDPFRGDPQSRANHNAAAWRDANPGEKLI